MKNGSVAIRSRRVLGILWTGLVLAAPAFSETRAAFSAVSVRIERHTGVVILASAAEGARTTKTTPITTSGNAPVRMIICPECSIESLDSRGVRLTGRIAVTVFEP